MTTTIEAPLTANAVLFGSQDAVSSVQDSLRRHGLLGAITAGAAHLTTETQDALQREVSTTAADLLNLDLVDVLVTAWRKHAALTAAARRTAAAPGSSEVVELATHHVTATLRPYIDLLVDDVRVGRVQLELQLDLTIAGLVAVVRAGCLAMVQSGDCTITATLIVEQQQVATRSAHFDLPLVISIGTGIPLLLSHEADRGWQDADRPGQGNKAVA
jgi:hypothetical protein